MVVCMIWKSKLWIQNPGYLVRRKIGVVESSAVGGVLNISAMGPGFFMQIELKPLYLNTVDVGGLVGFAEGGLSLTKNIVEDKLVNNFYDNRADRSCPILFYLLLGNHNRYLIGAHFLNSDEYLLTRIKNSVGGVKAGADFFVDGHRFALFVAVVLLTDDVGNDGTGRISNNNFIGSYADSN